MELRRVYGFGADTNGIAIHDVKKLKYKRASSNGPQTSEVFKRTYKRASSHGPQTCSPTTSNGKRPGQTSTKHSGAALEKRTRVRPGNQSASECVRAAKFHRRFEIHRRGSLFILGLKLGKLGINASKGNKIKMCQEDRNVPRAFALSKGLRPCEQVDHLRMKNVSREFYNSWTKSALQQQDENSLHCSDYIND